VGARLVSKRVGQFLDAAVLEGGAAWAYVDSAGWRQDPSHVLTHRIHAPPLPFVRALQHHLAANRCAPARAPTAYARTLQVSTV